MRLTSASLHAVDFQHLAASNHSGLSIVMREKIVLSWSGGKDSSLAYYYIQEAGVYEIVALLTTITEGYNRVSMHGVRRALLERQAESLGLPLQEVYIPKESTNMEYESRMKEVLLAYQKDGINSAGFGDIFLEDLRKYREDRLARIGMKAAFPLWKRDTTKLVRDLIDLGFEAIVTCVDSRVLDSSFAGKLINDDFISRLPPHVDPNGENGEFHSFVLDGPIFKRRVEVSIGEIVLRDSFYFCDLLPE
jgi:uncharacterized protein (TIGR00290 family)